MVEFNLSEKRCSKKGMTRVYRYYLEEDVKEFIRLLKEEILTDLNKTLWSTESVGHVIMKINKLAGDKLK